MSKHITPQEVFQAALDAYTAEQRQRFKLPATWEALSEHDRALFTKMAFELNCIVGEIQVTEQEEVRDA